MNNEDTIPENISDTLVYNNELAESLSHALDGGQHGFNAIPGLIKLVIEKECWRSRYVYQLRRTVTCESFKEFITKKPLEGLGADADILLRLCAKDKEVYDMLDMALQGKPGAPKGNKNAAKTIFDNVQDSINAPTGNTEAAALRRLRKESKSDKTVEKLYKKVLAGELSANAAMVKAGFRPKTVTIPVDVEKAAAALIRHFRDDTVLLIEAIQNLLAIKMISEDVVVATNKNNGQR